MKLLLIFVTTLLLAGCATSQPQQQLNIAVNQCPALKQYTKEQMAAAAQELRNLPSTAQINSLLTDYSKLRDACRIAEKKMRALVKKQKEKSKTNY